MAIPTRRAGSSGSRRRRGQLLQTPMTEAEPTFAPGVAVDHGAEHATRAAQDGPKISIQNATKVYAAKTGPVHALEGLSVDIREGELVCILGPSGCGKTTL